MHNFKISMVEFMCYGTSAGVKHLREEKEKIKIITFFSSFFTQTCFGTFSPDNENFLTLVRLGIDGSSSRIKKKINVKFASP